MIFRTIYFLFVFFGAVLWGAVSKAQDNPSLFVTDPAVPASVDVTWEEFAQATETTLAGPAPSLFRLNRMRDELVTWRDTFLDGGQINAGRIATVRGQIAALGNIPEDGDEPAAIADRRDVLNAQLNALRAPALLAEESYARADGLIAEVDSLLRGRDAAALTARSDTPLNPTLWPAAFVALGDGLTRVVTETRGALRADIASGDLWRNAPVGLFFLAVAGVLLLRGRGWVLRLQNSVDMGTVQGRAVVSFLVSLWQVILPFLGLLAFVTAVNRFDVLGNAGSLLLDAIFGAAVTIIIARWLTAEFFPMGDGAVGPLRQDADTRKRARRVAMALAWGLAAAIILDTVMSVAEAGADLKSVILFPVGLVLALFLFRLGRLLRNDPLPIPGADPEAEAPKGRSRRFVGITCQVVAVATPILSALGFATAAEALFTPSVLTLAIVGVVILLQRFVNDLWDMWAQPETGSTGALAPVLISFVLLLLALPILAVIWGASGADLFEIWTRFREGFSIGDTRISPTDFLTFATVFVVGYVLTRFIQGTLRTSVLPRTRLDLGGQNAVIAGFGYVGIALAAIVAITTAGIDLSNLAIVAGALSVGIGFGLQNIVSNFVSGIILLIERPIGEGDWIEVNGTSGYVRGISVRSTRIETFDRTDVIIPNADLVSGQVTNYTRGNAVGRVIVPVGVAYGTDTKLVHDILTEVATANPMVLLNPPPGVLFLEFGDSSLNFEIRAILRDVNFMLSVKSEMNFEIEKRFAEAGIEVPFPQRDLWIKNAEALKP